VSAFCDSTGGWLPLACVLNCTAPLDWVRGLFVFDHAAFDSAVAGVIPGARGLLFVPYLDGERTPNLPTAAGELHGLRASHGPAEIGRAVLEGVTAGLAHAVRAFRRTGASPSQLLLAGGGARSAVWGQLLADWLDLPIARPAVTEAAARGAAIGAAHAVSGAPFAFPVPADARWEPRPGSGVREIAAARQEASS
jgi:xylulokinase